MGDVLVVENHSEHAMNLVRMLDDLNMNWRLAGSVAEGVERIATTARTSNQGRACELLGISRPTLRRKMRRYERGIPKVEQVSSTLT